MKAFTIDNETRIIAFASVAEARPSAADGILVLAAEEYLATAATTWPAARLVEIWNSLAGVTPVHKFTNRQIAVRRIWNAIQNLEPIAPDTKGKATTATPREGTKKAAAMALLSGSQGATVDEFMVALGWQSHSVRGFLSNLNKRGPRIESFRREDGRRAYRWVRPTTVTGGEPNQEESNVGL